MDIKKILLISLITIAIVVSVSAVSAGLFDGLFGEEQKDNVIEIEHISFNTTNTTNFTHFKKMDMNENGIYSKVYGNNENGSIGEYRVSIIQFDDKDTFNEAINTFSEKLDSKTIVDGREVYLTHLTGGKYVGNPAYCTFIANSDLNQIILILSPDTNETVKMASTLKFK